MTEIDEQSDVSLVNLMEHARSKFQTGNYVDAESTLIQIIALSDEMHSVIAFNALHLLVDITKNDGRSADVIKYGSQLVSIVTDMLSMRADLPSCSSTTDISEEQLLLVSRTIRMDIAIAYHRSHHLEKAASQSVLLVKDILSSAVVDFGLFSRAIAFLGQLYFELHEYRASLFCFYHSATVDQRNDVHSDFHGKIGKVLYILGDEQPAIEQTKLKMTHARRTGDVPMQVEALRQFGNIELHFERYTNALQRYQEMLILAKRILDWKLQCEAHLLMGQAHTKNGTFNHARSHLEQAIIRAERCTLLDMKCEAEYELASVLFTLNMFDEAFTTTRSAIAHSERRLRELSEDASFARESTLKLLRGGYELLQVLLAKKGLIEKSLRVAEYAQSIAFNRLDAKHRSIHKKSRKSRETIEEVLSNNNSEGLHELLPKNSLALYYQVNCSGYCVWLIDANVGVKKFVQRRERTLRETIGAFLQSLITGDNSKCCVQADNRNIYFKKSDDDPFLVNSLLRIVTDSAKKSVFARPVQDRPESIYNFLDNHDDVGIEELDETNEKAVIEDYSIAPSEDNYIQELHGISNRVVTSAIDNAVRSVSQLGLVDEDSDITPTCTSAATFSSDISQENFQEEDESSKIALIELYKLLIEPVEHFLRAYSKETQLYIIADGILSRVPFHLLHGRGQNNVVSGMLYEQFNVRYASSLSSIGDMQQQQDHGSAQADAASSDQHGALVIGNPDLTLTSVCSSTGTNLSGQNNRLSEELKLVSQKLSVTCVSGKDATKSAFLQRFSRAHLVHIVTYGSHSAGHLLFTPDIHQEGAIPNEESYVVTTHDILQLKLSAKLVVLNVGNQCCHVGQPVAHALVDAILLAGARCVLVPMWSLPSLANCRMLVHLYDALEKDMSVHEAVHLLFTTARQSTTNPAFWGSFLLFGDSNVHVDIGAMKRSATVCFVRKCTSPTKMYRRGVDLVEFSRQLQNVLACILQESEYNKILMDMHRLIGVTLEQFHHFHTSPKEEQSLVPVTIDRSLLDSLACMRFLKLMGYGKKVSVSDSRHSFLILPPWNFDYALHVCQEALSHMTVVTETSNAASFHLSKIMLDANHNKLSALIHFLFESCENNKEFDRMSTEVAWLWENATYRRFLESVGVFALQDKLLCGCSHQHMNMRKSTRYLFETFIRLIDDNDERPSSRGKIPESHIWFKLGMPLTENQERMAFARSLHTVTDKFTSLKEKGNLWNVANVKSWSEEGSRRCGTRTIGMTMTAPHSAVRQNRGGVKTVRSAGGLPALPDIYASSKRPLANLHFLNQERAHTAAVFKEQKDDLATRRTYELEQVFAVGDVSPRFCKLDGLAPHG